MKSYYQNIIPEYDRFKQLHALLAVGVEFEIRMLRVGALKQEASDRISNGRYDSIDDLIYLRRAVSEGDKILQDLAEDKQQIEKHFQELQYLLN